MDTFEDSGEKYEDAKEAVNGPLGKYLASLKEVSNEFDITMIMETYGYLV